MANLTASEKKALSRIESEMARKGFDLGSIMDKLIPKEITAAASAGGAATETVAAVGLLILDVVVGVTQRVDGANSLPLLGWNRTGNDDEIELVYSADPGAGAIVEIQFKTA